MKDKLNHLFAENQFHRITSNISTITLYVQYRQDHASVVQVLDFQEAYPVIASDYKTYKLRAIDYMKSRGYENVDILTLVITSYVDECKKYVIDDDSVWILNSETKQLIVYERQIEDFCNLRSQIEDACVEMGGSRSVNPYRQYEEFKKKSLIYREFSLVNTILVVLNVVIFSVLSFSGSTLDIDYMLEKGVMFVPRILDNGEYYRFITCFFVHFGFLHLVGNMVVLMFLGDNVERQLGWWKYIILYMSSGLIGSIGSFTYAFYRNRGIVSAGASGAIYGVIGALLWLVIANKGRLEDMTITRVCVMIAYALYSGFTSENIDITAHLCGLVGGFLLAVILYRKEKKTDENKHLLWRKRNT